ncbi:hypothetical protein INT47_004146, partial [Mucor saturninus]
MSYINNSTVNTSMPTMHHINKSSSINIRLASLNCNSLVKTNKPVVRSDLIRFLRENSFNIISLQETHTHNDTLSTSIEQQFYTKSALWTEHCGIVSLHPDILLTQVDTPILDNRIILAKVTHSQQYFEPFFILNIYAPADNNGSKTQFYESLLTIPSLYQQDIIDRLFIMGDFNYSFIRQNQMRLIPDSWLTLLHSSFTDCLTHSFLNPIPTFHRNAAIQSTIDYIYASTSMYSDTSNGDVIHISRSWSDHNILTVDYCVGTNPTGRGVWRFNPLLLKNALFCQTLSANLNKLYPRLDQYGSVQNQWDQIKTRVKRVARKFSCQYISWRSKRLKVLYRQRNNIPRDNPAFEDREVLLPPIQNEIIQLQQDTVDIARLRSGLRWREQGETSAGYLKRTIKDKQKARHIDIITDPSTGVTYTDNKDKLDVTEEFYSSLYTADPIEMDQIQTLLDSIPNERKLNPIHQELLSAPISFDDIMEQGGRSPNPSSPGPDGLSYGLYNEALVEGIFPSSWHDSVMCLLPKKGDLSLLQNWRPISLTN